MPEQVRVATRLSFPGAKRPAFDVSGTFTFDDGVGVGEQTLREEIERILLPLHRMSLRQSYAHTVQQLALKFPGMVRGELAVRRYHPIFPFMKERAASTFSRPA